MMQIGEKINSLTLVGYAGVNKYRAKMGVFQCDCGNTKKIKISSVENKYTKSCGCSRWKHCVGDKWNKLELLKYLDKNIGGQPVGLFRCDCGHTKEIVIYQVVRGSIKSCGCGFSKKMQIGEKRNRLTLIEYTGMNRFHASLGLFKCDCGTEKILSVSQVDRGYIKSCGCARADENIIKSRSQIKNLTGHRFGRLLVLCQADTRLYGKVCWKCRCDCGNICLVISTSLIQGKTRSCGCLHREIVTDMMIMRIECNGGVGCSFGKQGRFNSIKMGVGIHYDSSYEQRAMELWETDSTISSFNRSKDRITYVNPVDGSLHVYLPDFVINDTRMIEVKPQSLLDDPVVQAKAIAAEAYCSERGMTYEIWTEHELGLIK